MTADIVVLNSVLGLLCLWFFQVYLWRDYRLDSFRDHVFSIRDRMFLFAAKGGISLEHEAYVILRNRMNVVLRYAHEFTLTSMIAGIISTPELSEDDLNPRFRWELPAESLPPETRAKLKEFSDCLAIAMLQHMVFGAFPLYLLVRPAMLLFRPIEVRIVMTKPAVSRGVERLEADALEKDARRISGHGVAVAA